MRADIIFEHCVDAIQETIESITYHVERPSLS